MNKPVAFALTMAIMIIGGYYTTAQGFELNPDRFPSIGLSVGYGQSETNSGLTDSEITDFRVDFRVPIAETATIFASYSKFNADSEINGTPLDVETDGFDFRFGVRVFMTRYGR